MGHHLLAAVFVILLSAVAGMLLFATRITAQERRLEERISSIRDPKRSCELEADAGELTRPQQGGRSERLGSYLRQCRLSAALERLLLEADSRRTVGWVAWMTMGMSAGCLLAAVFAGFSCMQCLVAAIAGVTLPAMKLVRQKRRRLHAVSLTLADASDLMARSLRSGHSLTQSIEVLAEQSPPPLGAEFGRVFQQQKLGVPLRDVLEQLGRRVPSRDLQFLITAIMVQRETGGDLAEILDRTAHLLRERIRIKGEVQVYTAQGRLTGWILSLLPVVLLALISLFSPAYAHVLFHDPVGQKLLYTGGGFILAGAMAIRKIVQVEV